MADGVDAELRQMSDDSGRRVYKVRGSEVETVHPSTANLIHTSTQSNLARVPPVVVRSQTGVTLMQSAILHTESLMHTQAEPESQVQVQSLSHTQPHIQVQSPLSQIPLQTPLPTLSQSSVINTMAGLVDATQEKMITVKEFMDCVQQQ
ncbi:hypothetical protein Hamer_G013044, partial [Homarus americanus]